jgi:hypothetical protein
MAGFENIYNYHMESVKRRRDKSKKACYYGKV